MYDYNYIIDNIEFTVRQNAGGLWNVDVREPFKEEATYLLGDKEKALEFVLSYAEV